MAFSSDAVANYILDCADRDSVRVSPMKLQKLLYFAQGWHLALESEGKPLIRESVQAWDWGPVFPAIYHEFKDFGSQPITHRAVEVRLDGKKLQFYSPNIDEEATETGTDLPFAKAILERVWKVYSRYSAAALSDMTHEKGSPWSLVREEAKKNAPGGMVPKAVAIPDQMIRDWFKTRFQTQAASKA